MKNILCFGDSNTYGIIPGSWNRYEESDRYPGILKKLTSSYNIIENGVVGRTTIYSDYREGRVGIKDIKQALIDTSAEYLILMIGTNDLKTTNAKNIEELKNGLDLFIKEAIGNVKKVIFINPASLDKNIENLDPDFNTNSYLISKDASKIYKELAKEYGFYYLDANDYATVGIDGEHITNIGHKALANAIYDLIVKIDKEV